MTCEHKNKAYEPGGITLTCYPPIHISNWICKDCGFQGQDRQQSKMDTEYQDTLNKFRGVSNITTNLPESGSGASE